MQSKSGSICRDWQRIPGILLGRLPLLEGVIWQNHLIILAILSAKNYRCDGERSNKCMVSEPVVWNRLIVSPKSFPMVRTYEA